MRSSPRAGHVTPGDEYAVVAGTGMPRVWCDGSRDILADLDDGRYTASVRGQTIAVPTSGAAKGGRDA